MMATGVVLEESTDYEANVPNYDALWKKLIEELFEEFIEFFAPDLYGAIDFSEPPDFLKQEVDSGIIDKRSGRLIADEIVQVLLKSGEERWILIHIEVQGDADEDFGKRMFQYFYRIFDRHDKEIYAIALITDGKKADLNQFSYSFFSTKLDYTYNVYKFDDSVKNIAKLEQSSNPFAAAVLAGIYANKSKKDVDKRYTFKRKLMIHVLKKFSTQQEDTRTYLSALFYFIDYLLQVSDPLSKQLREDIKPYLGREVVERMQAEKANPKQTLAEIFEELKEEGMKEGMKEGIVEGRKDAFKSFVRTLLRENYSDEQIAKLTELELEEVVELRKSLEI